MRFPYVLWTLLALSIHDGSATHIVGGEMSYTCLGNNNYLITLKVYRDCYLGQAPFDNPTYVFIYDGNGAQYTHLSIPFPGSDTLPNNANNPCIIVPPNICVEEAVFQWQVYLPPNTSGYKMIYQRCCRNNTIVNIVNPGGTGATYEATMPGSGLATCNSSPYFNNFPPTVICANYPFVFDHSATDPDGDSLVYELCEPYNGATSLNPYPFPPMAYSYVNFLAPYSATNPMGGLPPMSIDPVTGVLTVTPTTLGQFVVGVCVSEYRNGVLLSKKRRDFQFNVAACTLPAVASIPSVVSTCDDFTFNFPNFSTGASSYLWDFGVPNTNSDTSTQFSPTFTFPDTGLYFVTLIANPGSPCGDTATMKVLVYPTFEGNIVFDDGCVNQPVQFYDSSTTTFGNVISWYWTFGNLGSSFQQHPSFTFPSTGSYQVTLQVQNSLGCVDTVTAVVHIHPLPGAWANPDTLICYLDTIQLSGSGNGSYQWSPTNGLSSSTVAQPLASPDVTTTYTLTVTNQWGCSSTDSVTVQVLGPFDLVTSADTVICPGGTAQLSVSGGYTYWWVPAVGLSDPQSAQPTASPAQSTVYTVTTALGSCTDTAYVAVIIKPFPNISAGPDVQICYGDSTQLHACCATSYSWSPAIWITNPAEAEPWVFPPYTTWYQLTASDSNSCPLTVVDSVRVTVIYPMPLHSTPDTVMFLGTSAQLYAWGAQDYQWYPDTYLSATDIPNPIVTPLQSITYYINAITAEGCRLFDTISITVYEDPLVVLPNAFTPDNNGINDVFKPIYVGLFELEEFSVFNRWGILLFTTQDPEKGWDGTYGGRPEEIGTYVCYVRGRSLSTGKPYFLKGNFVLIR
ncbi:MAG: PKD domain-containing protein [Chitinophagales bacterium]|nr:PKD domain-containing protein [Chitinophagales bacterium]MDW8428297.1 PKD domain-containing protein [Chitinophagales bacterium]